MMIEVEILDTTVASLSDAGFGHDSFSDRSLRINLPPNSTPDDMNFMKERLESFLNSLGHEVRFVNSRDGKHPLRKPFGLQLPFWAKQNG